MKNSNLADLIEDIQAISDEVTNQFGQLSQDQLNWKPAADRWSIGQCLDHIITLNRTYFPLFEKIIQGEYRPSLWQRVPVFPSLFGVMIIKATQPESKKKYKTFPVFEPSGTMVNASISQDFIAHQLELTDYLKQFIQIEHQNIIISSPASKWIIYRLGDCFTLLTVHEKRHLKQAVQVMKSADFPR